MKILINAGVLQQIFKEHPEVEIELVKNASEQVAQAFKRKIDADAMARVLEQTIENKLKHRWTFPEEVKTMIAIHVKEAIQEYLKDKIEKDCRKIFDKVLDNYKISIEQQLNAKVASMVTTEFSNHVSAVAKMARRNS